MAALASYLLGFPLLEPGCSEQLDVTTFGWKLSDGQIEVDWDTPDNVSKVRYRVQHLLRGCSCKKGCTTRQCSCLKGGSKCGPGCTCRNCENVVYAPSNVEVETCIEEEEIEDDEALRQECFNEIVDDDSDDEVRDEDSVYSSGDEDIDVHDM